MKIDIFSVKIGITGRNTENPDEMTDIMSVSIIPEEETFKDKEKVPVVNINFMVTSYKEEDIDYICSKKWVTSFLITSGIFQLFRRVNFACNIGVNNEDNYSKAVKDKLSNMLNEFVNMLEDIINDKYVMAWTERPVFTVTTDEDAAKENVEDTEEVKEDEAIDNGETNI